MCNISSYYKFEYNIHKKYIILKVFIENYLKQQVWIGKKYAVYQKMFLYIHIFVCLAQVTFHVLIKKPSLLFHRGLMRCFQSCWFQLKNGTPVFWKKFSFSRKFVSKVKYWKRLKLSLIVKEKHTDLSNEGLFWKSVVPFFRRTYALSVDFKKTLRKSAFEC